METTDKEREKHIKKDQQDMKKRYQTKTEKLTGTRVEPQRKKQESTNTWEMMTGHLKHSQHETKSREIEEEVNRENLSRSRKNLKMTRMVA